jgi:hypothetical protein
MDIVSKYSWLIALAFALIASVGLRQHIRYVVSTDAELKKFGKWIFWVAVGLATSPWLMEGLSLLTGGAQPQSLYDRCHQHLYLRVHYGLYLLSLWAIATWLWFFGGGRILGRFGLNQGMSPVVYSVTFTVVTILFSFMFGRCLF